MNLYPAVSTAPTAEPVSLGEARAQLALDGTASDAVLLGHLIAAREEFEALTGRRLMTQTLTATVENWCAEFYPKVGPITSIAIQYTDADGVEQTLAADQYVMRPHGGDSLLKVIRPAYGVSWPTLGNDGQITFTFGAGYASANAVPASAKLGILVRTAELFENRTGPELSDAFRHFINLNKIAFL